MPQSPFTRYFALFIVGAFAFALLYPHEWAMEWGKKAIYALPLALGLLGWSAMRDAPPFDDRAFHRTLPPGDGPAFRRTLMTHLLVLGGISLVVLIYCWYFGMAWQFALYGILFLTLPTWAIMAATGIATSIGSSRSQWRSLGYIAVFASPVFSGLAAHQATRGLENGSIWHVFFTPARTVVVTAAVLYPLVWWLVAARRQRRFGAVFAALIGALLPWLWVYGDFVRVEDPRERKSRVWQEFEQRLGAPAAKWSRLPYKEGSDKWMPIQDVLAIEGLRRGEVARLITYASKEKNPGLGAWTLRDDLAPEKGGVIPAPLHASLAPDGSVEWGAEALWNRMREQMPSHESFGIWGRTSEKPERLVVLRPGASTVYTYPEEPRTFENRYTVDSWQTADWQMFSEVSAYHLLGDFKIAKGGSVKAPNGGKIIVDPMIGKDGKYSICFKRYWGDLEHSDKPWPEPPVVSWFVDPKLIVTDASGKHAFGVDSLGSGNAKPVWLGKVQQYVFFVGEAKNPEMKEKIESLKEGRLYLFWPEPLSIFRDLTLPPP